MEVYNKVLNKRKSKIPTDPDSGVEYLTPSLTVGVINGGVKVNIVPDTCVLEIDRRVLPEEKRLEAIGEFEKILEELKRKDENFNFELAAIESHDSFFIPEGNELIKIASEAYERVMRKKAKVLGELGCLDASHVCKHGIPVIAFGASRIDSNVHGVDEHVNIQDLMDFSLIVEEMLLRILK